MPVRYRTRITTHVAIHRSIVQDIYITHPPPPLLRRNTESLEEMTSTNTATSTTTNSAIDHPPERMMGPESFENSIGRSSHGSTYSSSSGSYIGPGTIISSTYELGRKLGEGSFGCVYSAKDSRGRNYAVKVEKSGGGTLSNEKNVYRKITFDKYGYQVFGIPRMYYFAEDHGCNVMVLDMLGSSLDKLRGRRSFSLKTCFMIALQLLARLEHIHQRGFVHRDLKPGNILIGRSGYNRTVYLVDYGLTKTFRDSRGRHIVSRSGTFVGTAQYASRNVMRSVRATRRDDLESLGYLLAELRRGDLPWSRIRRRDGNRERRVLECKDRTSDAELAEGFPGLENYLGYVRHLRFADRPSYRYLRDCFERKMRNLAIVDDGNFDWITGR